MRLTWLPPIANGGAAVADYIVQRWVTGTGWTAINDGISTATAYTVTGLANGTPYSFRVLAKNVAGNSSPSNTASAIPRTVPSAVRSLTATPGDRSVTLIFAAPVSNGGAAIDRYLVQRSINGGAWTNVAFTSGRVTLSGLTNGVRYSYRVSAHNAAGYGTFSPAVSAIPRTVPSAVRSLTATPGNRSVTLIFAAPVSSGGAAIDRYLVQRSINGGAWTSVAFTSGRVTLSGLTNGVRYSFRVSAHNVAGYGTFSPAVSAIPRTVPSAPSLRATPGNGRVSLGWTAPTSNGGSAITRYAIQRSTSPTGGWVYLSTSIPASSRSFTASNLRNATRYYFRIIAVTAVGSGPWSATVSAVPTALPPPTPGCDPSYPTVCIPPPPPDLDCSQISHRRFTVRQPDPHRFDGDFDGVGCET